MNGWNMSKNGGERFRSFFLSKSWVMAVGEPAVNLPSMYPFASKNHLKISTQPTQRCLGDFCYRILYHGKSPLKKISPFGRIFFSKHLTSKSKYLRGIRAPFGSFFLNLFHSHQTSILRVANPRASNIF